ncbi:VOC family protein [Mucilaginibacter pocheonensis]|uniref:PhnB protein n=1 Tax=Mucilaginibacter pocheonensis TaxID=398050 RepID=A0ABU1T956_9SPHI|nr:VOC family protein [Mucilaginibacter pocheonensis]MDR6941909.1 PhnB protein [Mucilaginibacter pocheonensis]
MQTKPTFAPQLVIPNGVTDISFYLKAFGATELRRFSNDDGTIHVSELSINGTLFHLHEQTGHSAAVSPDKNNGTTVTIGLFVDDVYAVVARAVEAGATITSPVQDYDYGYRQGDIRDPFGHLWMIEKVI